MMSVNRSGFVPGRGGSDVNLPPIPLEVFITTNPYGPGHNWVKKRFIDPAPYGRIVRTEFEIEKPGGGGERVKVSRSQVAIFGSWRENPYLDAKYIAGMMSERNQAKKKAWLDGNWDVVAGGAIDDVWDRARHVVPRFIVPRGWTIERAFDWGSSHPFYVGWFARCDGTSATIVHAGREFSFCPPKGSLVLVGEWYGADPQGTNEGLKMASGDIARGVLLRETLWQEQGWFNAKPNPGPADNQIFASTQSDELTIAQKMAAAGVSWKPSNKAPGSRINGLQLVRDRLEATLKGEGKALFFQEHCTAAISTIPVLPRDIDKPDDVDTDAEDHPYDVLRYEVLYNDVALDSAPKISFA
jgi:hypothetical protein